MLEVLKASMAVVEMLIAINIKWVWERVVSEVEPKEKTKQVWKNLNMKLDASRLHLNVSAD